MLKKAFAVAAIAGLGFIATPANAAACLDVYLNVNGTEVAQNVCTPV